MLQSSRFLCSSYDDDSKSQQDWSGLLTYVNPLLYSLPQMYTFNEQEGYICNMRDDTLETRGSE